jgi:hypothetical protein
VKVLFQRSITQVENTIDIMLKKRPVNYPGKSKRRMFSGFRFPLSSTFHSLSLLLHQLNKSLKKLTRPKRRLYFGWFGGVQMFSTGGKL